MSANPIDDFLAKLDGVKPTGTDKWMARCPAHDDMHASMSVKRADDGKVLFNCKAGCLQSAVIEAMHIEFSDLFPDKPTGPSGRALRMPTNKRAPQAPSSAARASAAATPPEKPPQPYKTPEALIDSLASYFKGAVVGPWDYGTFQVVRFNLADGSKQYRPFHHNGKGWVVGDPPGLLPLYQIDKLPKDGPVGVAEGEKCVEIASSTGLYCTTSAHGAKAAGKSDWTPLAGRDVIILPDNDAAGEQYALDVAEILTALKPAAKVKFVYLPGLPDGGDIADWVHADGTMGDKSEEEIKAAILELAQKARPWAPPAPTPQAGAAPATAPAPDVGMTKQLADAILAQHFFARDPGGKLYIYADGLYRPGGEAAVRRAVKHLLDEWGDSAHWSVHRADETAAYIAVDAPELWERPPLDVLNLANGLLNVHTRELRPHDPAFLSAVQLPVSFDPAAMCPAWEQFIADVFPADALLLPWQLAAWLMLPTTSIQKAILLTGEGSNGKSTFLRAKIAFLGKRNVATLSLHRLESDRFSVARLVGKLANICSDLPSAHLTGTSTFKALSGGDVLLGERKYGESFEFVPFARMLFSANHPPRSADASHAFFRRWLVVPFERFFEGAAAIPRDELDARLADPHELSGVLNHALDALAGVLAGELIETPTMKAAWDELRATTDPLAVWLDANTIEAPDVIVPKRDLLAAYCTAARAEQRLTMTAAAFGIALKRLRPQIEEGQRTVNGDPRVWVWLGIGLRATGDESPGSHGGNARNSTCCLPGIVKD